MTNLEKGHYYVTNGLGIYKFLAFDLIDRKAFFEEMRSHKVVTFPFDENCNVKEMVEELCLNTLTTAYVVNDSLENIYFTKEGAVKACHQYCDGWGRDVDFTISKKNIVIDESFRAWAYK